MKFYHEICEMSESRLLARGGRPEELRPLAAVTPTRSEG